MEQMGVHSFDIYHLAHLFFRKMNSIYQFTSLMTLEPHKTTNFLPFDSAIYKSKGQV